MSTPDGSENGLETRIDLAECWEQSAPGWIRHRGLMWSFSEPVSRWLIEAVAPQPRQRVLELGAGIGETGLLAAELVGPEGEVIVSDQSERMLDGARERAAELGARNVTFKRMDAEWIDLPVASVDAVVYRWALMLLVDPAASLTEARRVLRPEGRIAVAVWDTAERNAWLALPGQVLRELGLVEPAPPRSPGPFALADRPRLGELLELAGFTEVTLDALELSHRVPSFESYWETRLDLASSFHDAVMGLPEPEIARVRDALEVALAPFREPDGSLALPASTLLAGASA